MKKLAILVEPAEYTLDMIENVYRRIGADIVFVKTTSTAGPGSTGVAALGQLGLVDLCRKLLSYIRLYDLFHVNGYTGRECAMFIVLNILFYRKPFTIDSDTELNVPRNLIKRIAKRLWLQWIFTRRYAYGFAGGNCRHKDLFLYYGMDEERVFLAPMVVDNSRYARMLVPPTPRRPFRFGYIGRLVQCKQVDKIIEAFKLLLNAGVDAELVIVGDGPEKPRLKEIAEALPIGFTGRIFGKEKIAKLHDMDALILYSSYESWGLVVNEALSAGIPVIVSNKVGSASDLVMATPQCGLVAKWNSTTDLSEKMRMVCCDVELWQKLSRGALKRMEKWNYGLYIDNYMRFLEQVKNKEG